MTNKIRVCALLGCNHCGFWSGWVSKRFDPDLETAPETINTTCSVCGGRLRHKRGRRDPERTYTHIYTKGRGAHNRSESVFKYRQWYEPSTCKSEAARINRDLLKIRAKIDPENFHFGFKKAKDLKKK